MQVGDTISTALIVFFAAGIESRCWTQHNECAHTEKAAAIWVLSPKTI
jgi:hypothetical protein